MPYITASIIIQLLTVVIPRFEALKEEGQTGTSKLTQYTRYLTIGLARPAVDDVRGDRPHAGACSVLLPGDPDPNDNLITILIMVITMTAGTGLIMWLGELVTEKGVGNGMSLLIFTSIAAHVPELALGDPHQKSTHDSMLRHRHRLVIMALVVFVEQCQRRIPVQYAKRMVGRRMYGGSSTYIPIKVNMAGVIPVIFASSLLYLPALIAQFQRNSRAGWVDWINTHLVRGDHPIYIASYFLLIVFFTYFYVRSRSTRTRSPRT
jgi:preprotein translocase subunit SecY